MPFSTESIREAYKADKRGVNWSRYKPPVKFDRERFLAERTVRQMNQESETNADRQRTKTHPAQGI